MNKITRNMIKLIKERGEDYYDTFKNYEYNLKDKDLFWKMGTESLNITSITFKGNGNTFNKFNHGIGDIIIKCESLQPNYCNNDYEDWEEQEIKLPSWIFEEEEKYQNEKERLLKRFQENELNAKIRIEDEKRKQLHSLAKELEYEIFNKNDYFDQLKLEKIHGGKK